MQSVAKRGGRVATRTVAPGVRVHLFRTDRFATTYCRVVLAQRLSGQATATAVLAKVLESATARHPTRKALADRLADLYGAVLGVGVSKHGDHQLLSASLEWPTAFVPGAGRLLGEGLALLGEVLAHPKRGGDAASGALDEALVEAERTNHGRALAALADDKAHYALRRGLEIAFRGEPFGLQAEGRRADLGAVAPRGLARLHARLLATSPVEVLLVGDLPVREGLDQVRRHLLWRPRGPRIRTLRPPGRPRGARARPRRVVERDDVSQGRLVQALRARVGPRDEASAAGSMLAGVLGGGSYGRFFKIVRETHGLCYDAGAGWNAAKGLLLFESGMDPEQEPRVRRLLLQLLREVARGHVDARALHGQRASLQHRFALLGDDPRAWVAWTLESLLLGLDPRPSRRLARLLAVTPSEIAAIARRVRLDATFFLTRRRRTGQGGRA